MDSKELLTAAKQLLVDKGWTQGMYARSNSRGWAATNSPTACEFCMAGSVMAAAGISVVDFEVDFPKPVRDAMGALVKAVGEDDEYYSPLGQITDFNDNSYRTKQEVLDVFDKAIANCG